MLILLSPAKTLDFETQLSTPEISQPRFLQQSAELIDELRQYSPEQIGTLMKLSTSLSELNVKRYHDWQLPFDDTNAKAAILAFKGDVYTGLAADQWSQNELAAAQSSLRILSGLYGLLKPLDLIQPYRLEMGTKLANEHGNDLYQFWGNQVTDRINADCQEHDHQMIVNLASNEYFKSVKAKQLNSSVITPVFKDEKKGQFKIISFYAKKARGLMAAYLIRSQAQDLEDVKQFSEAGYRFSQEDSNDANIVFKRREEDIPK